MKKYMVVVLDDEGRTFAFFHSDYTLAKGFAQDCTIFDHWSCEIYIRVMDHYELLEVQR